MSTRATALSDMSIEQLDSEVFARRAAYQRALSAVKARGDDGRFEAYVHSHLADVQMMRGEPLEVTMYAATVTDHSGGFDIRGVWPTRAEAMRRLEREIPAIAKIEWDSFGEFAVSKPIAGLQYHVDPVKVMA